MGFFLGLPSKGKKKSKSKNKKNPENINFRQFGVSLGLSQRGAELSVGCLAVLWKEAQNQVDSV